MNPAEAYILDRDEPFRSILLELQALIALTIPEAELRYKYRIPYFYLKGKPFCYLNQSGDYVDLGFWHSAYLTKHLDKMHSEGRKVIRSLRYKSLGEIDQHLLSEVLEEAASFAGRSFYKR